MNYYFGNKDRLNVFCDIHGMKKLNFLNFFFLRKNDVIYHSKAWSPIIFYIFKKKNRPTIIQFADGLVTESNCNKKVNRVPHKLYQSIYADLFVVRQNLKSLPNFIEPSLVKTIYDYELEFKEITFKSIVFVFGNDPFVTHSRESIIKELQKLDNTLVKKIPIFYSANSKKIKYLIKELFPNSIDIGPFSSSSINMSDSLIISTPSTVAHDHVLNGGYAVRFDGGRCNTMQYLFKSTDSLKFINSKYYIDVIGFKNIQKLEFKIPKNKIHSKVKVKYTFIGVKRLLRDFLSLAKYN